MCCGVLCMLRIRALDESHPQHLANLSLAIRYPRRMGISYPSPQLELHVCNAAIVASASQNENRERVETQGCPKAAHPAPTNRGHCKGGGSGLQWWGP